MDLILLDTPAVSRPSAVAVPATTDGIAVASPVATAAAGSPRLFTAAGLDALQRLLVWLAEDRLPTEIYVELPAAAEERRLALESLGPRLTDLPVVLYFLVPVTELTGELLRAFEDAKLHNIIVLGSDGTLVAEVEALRNVRVYFDQNPESRLALGAWLEDRAGHENFRRTRQYRRAGISPDVITSPLFARRGGERAGAGSAVDVPAELVDGLPPCRLFRNALTVDADGVVRLCPREQGGLGLGHLFTSPPEDLIGAKGACAAGAGGYPACRTCDWRGRFAWPERKSPRLEQLLAAGALRPATGGSDALARLDPIAHRDLTAAPAEEVAGDLAAFDERLAAWRESMKDLDGVEK